MSQGMYNFWMILPFVWGGIGVLIIGIACIRELLMLARAEPDALDPAPGRPVREEPPAG